jgi:hypothetical protein
MPFGDMVQISLTEGGETITVTEPAGVTVGDLRGQVQHQHSICCHAEWKHGREHHPDLCSHHGRSGGRGVQPEDV